MKDIIIRVIATLHFIYILFLSFYPWIFRKNKYDIIVLLVLCTNILSWTLYDGYCPVTYHLMSDTMSSKPSRIPHDLMFIFQNKPALKLFSKVVMVLYAFTLFFLLRRNNYPENVQMITVIMYVGYNIAITMNGFTSRIITEIVKLYFVLFILLAIYNLLRSFLTL